MDVKSNLMSSMLSRKLLIAFSWHMRAKSMRMSRKREFLKYMLFF